MATPIVIPREGQSMESATIVNWLVKVGDKVDFAQPLCEVESEKAVFEIESPVEGTLLDVFYSAGETAPVLKTIAVVGDKGEDYSSWKPANDIAEKPEKDIVTEPAEFDQNKEYVNTVVSNLNANDEKDTEKVLVSPRAKKLIADKGLNVQEIKANPITEKDVLEYISTQTKMSVTAHERMQSTDEILQGKVAGAGNRNIIDDFSRNVVTDTRITISGMRKTIAERMHSSLQNTAQFTLNCYADATNLLKFRKRLKESTSTVENVSINDVFLFATSKALVKFPQMNAHFSNGIYTKINDVSLGFAVELDEGLIVPTITNADKLSLNQISKKAKELAISCKDGTIKPTELEAGTFTVSNLGSLGVESFTPILNYPEVGILGVGAIVVRPVRTDDRIIYVDQIALSLTVNHQVIDGAVGARFLNLLSSYIANVELLLAL